MRAFERLLQYVPHDTQSNPKSTTYPSTPSQKTFGEILIKELETMGIHATMDPYGYVIGKIPSNTKDPVKTVALIAHMDTSFDASGKNVQPRIIHDYDLKTITLNPEKDLHLDPEVFPRLKELKGHDLIVTDGTTLLGADDKAGIAEIMTLAEILTRDSSIPHGEIVIVFTPDEEIGKGTDYIDITKIGADFAYTLDGSQVGEIAYENFNAAEANVTLNGQSVHPGSAKNKMVNSLRLAMVFDGILPPDMRPELTEKYEGFNHLTEVEGRVEKTVMTYIIRNHDTRLFESQKADFIRASALLNEQYGPHTCSVKITDSYYNMRQIIDQNQHIIALAIEAIQSCGITPLIEPIRGGTDGARLTYMGLPCPNLGTGGYNFHGPYEFVSIQEMDQAVEILVRLITNIARHQ
jgi:tripeptide aminopeptidase